MAEILAAARSELPCSICSWIHAQQWHALPSVVRAKARLTLLDTLGCASAGACADEARVARAAAAAHYASPAGAGARLLFDGRLVAVAAAAFANTQAADSCDAHDGFGEFAHVTASIAPALLAVVDYLGQRGQHVSSDEFMLALVLGQELTCRFGQLQQCHISSGVYMPSGLACAYGVCAATCRLLRLDVTKTQSALGIAECHAPRVPTHGGLRPSLWPTHLRDLMAWGSHAGVSSALLALEGFEGSPCGILLEHNGVSPGRFFTSLGTEWLCLDLYCKPFPCCFWAMTAVRLCLLLRRLNPTACVAENISAVRILTFREACALGAKSGLPSSAVEAQYSIVWPVACALAEGDCSPRHSEAPALNDSKIKRIFGLVELKEDAEMSRSYPPAMHADVEIALVDGTVLVARTKDLVSQDGSAAGNDRILFNRTAPELGHMGAQDVINKYERYARDGLGSSRCERIRDMIWGQCAAAEAVEVFDVVSLLNELTQPLLSDAVNA